jgi:hypothetical protein
MIMLRRQPITCFSGTVSGSPLVDRNGPSYCATVAAPGSRKHKANPVHSGNFRAIPRNFGGRGVAWTGAPVRSYYPFASIFRNFCCVFASFQAGGRDMSTTKDRIELSEAILALIAKKRVQTCDETLGAEIEQVIVESQFQDLESEILENPGAIEPWLVRRRRIEN